MLTQDEIQQHIDLIRSHTSDRMDELEHHVYSLERRIDEIHRLHQDTTRQLRARLARTLRKLHSHIPHIHAFRRHQTTP